VTYKISTEQVERTGDILGIAIVERLDRVVAVFEEISARLADDEEEDPDG